MNPHPARIRVEPTKNASRQCIAFRGKHIRVWKQRVMSPGQAISVTQRGDVRLHLYRCESCGYVHAGNTPRSGPKVPA